MDSRSSDNGRLRLLLGVDAADKVEMSETDLSQCMRVFREFKLANGLFPVARLREGLEAAEIGASGAQIEEIAQSLLDAGVEAMEFYDFATLVCSRKRSRRRRSTHAVLASVFQLLDRDRDGFISAAELKDSMELLLGASQTAGEAAEEMVRQLDTSGRGKVSYDEFACCVLGESRGALRTRCHDSDT